MRYKNLPFAILIILIITVISTSASATRYYISPTGNNTSGDGSRSNPYQTLNHLSRYVMTPGVGDTIVLMEGTYPSQVAGYNHQFRGSPGNYIVIMGDPDAASRPLVNGGGTTDANSQYGFAINARYSEPSNNNPDDDVQYIKITGIDFINCYQCITMSDGGYPDSAHDSRTTPAHHMIIENCTFGDSRNPIKWAGVDTFFVTGCDFYNHTNACIDLVGCHYGTVMDCVFRDHMVYERGVGLDIKGGSKDVTVARCHFRDLGMYGLNIGQVTGPAFFRPAYYSTDSDGNLVNYEAKDVNVYANIFDNTSIPVRFATSIGSKIYNNTVYQPTPYSSGTPASTVSAFNIYAYHTNPASNGNLLVRTRDGEIKNNIVYYALPSGYSWSNRIWWASSTHTEPTTFLLSHNLWYCFMDPAISIPDWDFLDEYNYGAPQHNNNIEGDPLFLVSNPEVPSNFQLDEGSPAAGRGTVITNEIYDFFNEKYIDGEDYNYQPWTVPPAVGAFGTTLEGVGPMIPRAKPPLPSELSNLND